LGYIALSLDRAIDCNDSSLFGRNLLGCENSKLSGAFIFNLMTVCPAQSGLDPQEDEDLHVRAVKSALWLDYARCSRLNADVRVQAGDLFGAQLSQARAEVRRAAAQLLLTSETALAAAQEMHRRAIAHSYRDLPLIGFDAAALDYTRARIWQDCAWAIDPTLPEVQARLFWE
jgi:hypothetical protein